MKKTITIALMISASIFTCSFSGCVHIKTVKAERKAKLAELHDYLQSPELLQRLNLKVVGIIEQEGDTASVGVPGGTRSHGMVYYTIQRGWYLPEEYEEMVHIPGNGWMIKE